MRSEDGKHFENVVGVADRETGEEFVANVLDCERPMNVGDKVKVGDKVFQYHGEDSLGRSMFTIAGRPVTDALFGRAG
jgi:hypothetical protein